MKKTFLIALMLGISLTTQAQETDLKAEPDLKQRKNEIGFTTQTDMFSTMYNSNSLHAIQYKRWKNQHFGARFLLGYGDYQTDEHFRPIYTRDNDTIIRSLPVTYSTLGFAGVGLEAQRQFYKRVILFAAVEARFGFGSGSVDTATEYSHDNYSKYVREPYASTTTADIFTAYLTPTIGGKIEFKRINFGTELALNLMQYTSATYTNMPTTSTFIVDLTKLNPRFFVHYRF